MNMDIESMISPYIEGEISDEDKKIFENYMDENPKFFKKINIIRNIINQFNNKDLLSPSENFIDNLHSKISKLSEENPIKVTNETNLNYWFSTNFKATLGFSFVMIFVGIFFINRTLTANDEVNISNINNSNEKSTLLSESDSLKTDNEEYPIHQVKGSSNGK